MTETDYYRKPDLWGRSPEPYQVQVRADLLALLPHDAASILDIGCGDGFLTDSLPIDREVTGFDLSATALRHLRRRGVVGSADALPFPAASFDLVACNDVLEHLDDRLLAAVESEIRRVARRYVIVTVPLREDLIAATARCRACGTGYHVNHHVRSWNEDGLLRLFAPDFVPLELRYSGALLCPPPDPFASLLAEGGVHAHWERSKCPRCGAEPGALDARQAAVGQALLDTLRARHWWGRDPAKATHVDRSEAMVLFARRGDPATARVRAIPAPAVESRDLLTIDFANDLQLVEDWSPGATLARWRTGSGVALERGALTAVQESGPAWFEVSFPIEPTAGDRILVEHADGSHGSVRVFAWDGLVQSEMPLVVVDGAPGNSSFELGGSWHPSRFGARANIHLDHGARLRRLCYRPRHGATEVTFVTVEPGYSVLPVPAPGVPRSYGLSLDRGGSWPAPRYSDTPAPTTRLRLAEILAMSDEIQEAQRRRGASLVALAERLAQTERATSVANAELREQLAATRRLAESRRERLVPTRAVQRVLVMANWFPSEAQPGLGSFVLEQVQALRRVADLDVRVITGRPFWVNRLKPHLILGAIRAYRRALAAIEWTEWDGVPVLAAPYLVGTPFTFVTHAATYTHAMRSAAVTARRSFPFDLVHAHTAYVDGTAGIAIATGFGVPIVITEHTNPFSMLTRNPLIRHRTMRTIRLADRAFAVSESLAEEIRGWLRPDEREQLHVLRNGVDTSRFAPPSDWLPDRARPRFAAIGIMHDYKNPLLLLEAFARVVRDLPGAELHLVGDGPLTPRVMESARSLGVADAVHHHGRLERDAVAALLAQRVDALVVASRSETFGVVVIEALASGKPVVSTRCGGPETILDDPRLGELCANHDADALARAMKAVAARLDPHDVAFRRRTAETRYSLDGVAGELAAQYQIVAREHADARHGGGRRP